MLSPQESGNKYVIPFVLDALIRSGATLPVQEATKLYDLFPDAAIVLVGRQQGGATEFPALRNLLSLAERDRNRERWLTLASVLQGNPEFKEYLIKEVRLEYSIAIQEDGEYGAIPEFVQQPDFGSVGGFLGRIPGSPKETSYCLSLAPARGDRVLAHSSYWNVYLRESPSCISSDWKEHPRDVVRVLHSFAFCELCAADSMKFPAILGGRAEIRWKSPDQVQRALRKSAQAYIEECRRFLSALEPRVWTDDEVRAKAEITVSDLRQDRLIPIPDSSGFAHRIIQ